MNKIEEAQKAFLKVRDILNTNETHAAYLLCWKKIYKFYREHTTKEAINILISESED